MQTSRFEAHVRRAPEAAVVELDGDVDVHAEAALERAYDDATAAGARIVTLDFSSVGYINSTGIAVLVGLLARGRRDRVELEARGLSDHYREIFEITRIADFVRIVPDGDAS
jgi:anti-anti-sigma factor